MVELSLYVLKWTSMRIVTYEYAKFKNTKVYESKGKILLGARIGLDWNF